MNQSALSLSAAEARLLALSAQGLIPHPDDRATVLGVLKRVGAIQLDTIAVLTRSHELIAYSRLGPVGRQTVDSCFWGQRAATAFEAWAHAASILPVEAWPYFGFRRREKLRSGDGERIDPRTLAYVRAKLQAGPITTAELGGRAVPGRFATRSPEKQAAEWLLSVGEAVCADRRRWQRVYDLPERALPPAILGQEASDAECIRYLVERAVMAMGVATRQDISDYYHLRLRDVDQALADSDLVQVRVAGWEDTAWAPPGLLEETRRPADSSRTTLLSPFDSLIWDRGRMKRLFGTVVLLEAYRRKSERAKGYFTMPLLFSGELVGWVDPARDGKTLVARRLHIDDPVYVSAMQEALLEAASWVSCDNVVVEETTEEWMLTSLRGSLSKNA